MASRTDTIPSADTSARFKRGLDWESTLFSWLDESGLLLRVPGQPLQADVLLENILADEREHFYIAGILVHPPQEQLLEKFTNLGSEPVDFGICKPDLLEINRGDNGITWKVLDAKSSKAVKTSHHVQIYFYTLCLEHVLKHPAFIPSGVAGIWLPPEEGFDKVPPSKDNIKSIQTSLLSNSFDLFLFKQLPYSLSLPRNAIRWHFNPLCRDCDYNAECRHAVLREGGLGSMPNISISDATVLQELLSSLDRSGTDIEDLHRLVSVALPDLEKAYPTVAKKGKRILGIHRRRPADGQMKYISPVLQSVRTGDVEVISRRNFAWPNSEDVAVVVSVIQDPTLPRPGLDFFAITVFRRGQPTVLSGNCEEFIPSLANVVRQLTSISSTTQFYVWSIAEHTALQNELVRRALSGDGDLEDVRLCIGALSQGASLLKTEFQPVLLSGVLLRFLAHPHRSKSEYQAYLARMGLPTQGTSAELRTRILQALEELQRLDQSPTSDGIHTVGQIHPIVVLKRELESMLAFPIPGYWDMDDCLRCLANDVSIGLCIPSDEHIVATFKTFGCSRAVVDLLSQRNANVLTILVASRRLISKSSQNLLVNSGTRLTSSFMDICHQSHLKRLFFMQQFEVLSKLNDLWSNRMAGCPDSPLLEYRGEIAGPKGAEHAFNVVAGPIDTPHADRDVSFFDYLLVEDVGGGEEIPVEAIFNDIVISGLIVPFSRQTERHWGSQPSVVREHVALADISSSSSIDGKAVINARTYNPSTHYILKPGHYYRLSPRLVDFNTSKILSSLLELDLEWEIAGNPTDLDHAMDTHRKVPFLQLVVDPRSFEPIPSAMSCRTIEERIQRLFKILKDLDVVNSGNLLLKPSQRKATQRLLTQRLTVIWGPPGSGKTHTIALSILRLVEVNWKLDNRQQTIIFVTAMTHDAINACLSKITRCIEWHRSIEHVEQDWLRDMRIEKIVKGSDHPGPSSNSASTYIYAGTLYQLYNFTKTRSVKVDCIVADEAGQITTASLSLVLRNLSSTSRIIVAGDSEQLSPIYNAKYPRLGGAPLFGSVLDCVMADGGRTASDGINSVTQFEEAAGSFVVQLTENFRLNPDLGQFISTIYALPFQHQKVQSRQLPTKLKEASHMKCDNQDRGIDYSVQAFLLGLSDVMAGKHQSVFQPPRMPRISSSAKLNNTDGAYRPVSLSLIRLSTRSVTTGHIGYDAHVHGEAALAASLVDALRHCLPDEDIFVATPLRAQREAVRAALDKKRRSQHALETAPQDSNTSTPNRVTIDTIERLQGSEASFVICLFSLSELYSTDLGFFLSRGRLNVAISRAKTLCILITSRRVLYPPLSALQDEETAKGYAFLKAYEDRAWSCDVSIDLEVL